MAGTIERNNIHVRGASHRAMVFAHGFGCDQNMWRFVAPAFEKDFMTVVFDHVGAGGSDLSAYDRANIRPCPATPMTWSKSARSSD
jgi:sigma-B regulation protein RsbQ